MAIEEPQAIWDDYFRRKKLVRLAEAPLMWEQVVACGVTEETVLALDFVIMSSSLENLQRLAEQLTENYNVEIVAFSEPGYWAAKGTTRPYGITLTKEQHVSWVEYMCELSEAQACVFLNWTLEAKKLDVCIKSEHIEVDS